MKDQRKISKYIDRLNAEKKPGEHGEGSKREEFEALAETVRKLRSLREPVMPKGEYVEQLKASLHGGEALKQAKRRKMDMKKVVYTLAAAAATSLFITIPGMPIPGRNENAVKAMEQAYQKLQAYHGIMEVVEINGLGESILQARREVWADKEGNYHVEELDGPMEGMVTANNGQKYWQFKKEEKEAYLFAAYPDSYRFTFELGSEVMEVTGALSVKEAGEEVILGREATILEVTPDGGNTYRLWLDKETNLPLKKETAMQNALQLKVAYTEFELLDAIPEELLSYQLPEGYEEINTSPEQMVFSLEEAEQMAGFLPVLPIGLPAGYELDQMLVQTEKKAVKLVYQSPVAGNKVVLLQQMAKEALQPEFGAILGLVGGSTAEILHSYQGNAGTGSIRWQEAGMEYTVYGSLAPEKLTYFAEGLTGGEVLIPESGEKEAKPQIEVPVDLKVEENDQKSVDAGHSPWRLDPAFTAQVFANILISPEGITGEYEIPYESVTIIENDGVEAIAKINSEKSIAEYVYLKRLIRQDETGIWTVIGYDPVIQ